MIKEERESLEELKKMVAEGDALVAKEKLIELEKIINTALTEGDAILKDWEEKQIDFTTAAYIFIHILGRIKDQINHNSEDKQLGKKWVMNIIDNVDKI